MTGSDGTGPGLVINANLIQGNAAEAGSGGGIRQLRQASTPEPGRFYPMAFSNPGGLVKTGDRVSVVIGQFHIDGLVIE